MSGSQPLLCAPVQSGYAPPLDIPKTVVGNANQRAPSPLSDCEKPKSKTGNGPRKRQITLRFPCKARGVMENHTPSTAYVDVPPRAEHGTILLCSHPVCAASGRKFRYCSVCLVPVAKRNFGKRHSHGLHQGPPAPPSTDDDDSSFQQTKRQRLESLGSLGEALRLALEQDHQHELANATSKEQEQIPKTVVIDVAPSVTETLAEVSAGSVGESTFRGGLTDQERMWLDLFRSRPAISNEADVRTWMDAILRTVDLKAAQPQNVETRDDEANAGDDEVEADPSILELLMDSDFLGDWSGY